MNLDCVGGDDLGLDAKWVVYDRDTGEIWGATYIDSEAAWIEAADRLAGAVAKCGVDVSACAIPRERLKRKEQSE